MVVASYANQSNACNKIFSNGLLHAVHRSRECDDFHAKNVDISDSPGVIDWDIRSYIYISLNCNYSSCGRNMFF